MLVLVTSKKKKKEENYVSFIHVTESLMTLNLVGSRDGHFLCHARSGDCLFL